MVAFLLKHGAHAHLPDDKPWATPLAWAIRHKQNDLVQLLTAARQAGATNNGAGWPRQLVVGLPQAQEGFRR